MPLLAKLEYDSWTAPLRASEETFRKRLSLGHTMLGAVDGGRLAGAICFIETNQDPLVFEDFPKNFEAYASLPRSEPVHALYAYNLCVLPHRRGGNTAVRLLKAMEDHGRRLGARWLIGDGRCSSYIGLTEDETDKVKFDPQFRAAIDSWNATGVRPPVEDIIRDPILRLHHRVYNCEFLYVMPDFLPSDPTSGGFNVISAKDLRK